MPQARGPLQQASPKELAAALKARYPILAENMVIEIQGALFRVKSFGKTRAIIETLHGAEIRRGSLTPDAARLVARAAAGKSEPWSVKVRRWLGWVGVVALAFTAPASAAPTSIHLCPPNLCNGSAVLNPPLAAHRGVLDFLVSPTGDRVFYRADISSDSKYELWTVPIAGGASVKLNSSLAFDYDVEGYAATSDGLTVVYRSGRTDSNDWKLYRVRATGGHVAQISDTVTGSKPVDRDFEIAPDDLTVVYLLTTTARNLYSTPLATPHSTRINQDLVTGGNVMPGFSVDRDGHVRFRADARVNNRIEWWLGRIGGGPVLAEIFSDSFESGNVGAWR